MFLLSSPPAILMCIVTAESHPSVMERLWVGEVGKRFCSGNPQQKELLSECRCCSRAKGERWWSLGKLRCMGGFRSSVEKANSEAVTVSSC